MTFKQRLAKAATVTVCVAALLASYAAFTRFTGFMFRCPFREATGFDCPGCGSQRAFHALLDGDLPGAVSYNPLLPFSLLYLAALAACWLFSDSSAMRSLNRLLTSATTVYLLAGIILIWWILRNLPA